MHAGIERYMTYTLIAVTRTSHNLGGVRTPDQGKKVRVDAVGQAKCSGGRNASGIVLSPCTRCAQLLVGTTALPSLPCARWHIWSELR